MDFANVGICYVDFAMPHCVFFLMIVAKYRNVFSCFWYCTIQKKIAEMQKREQKTDSRNASKKMQKVSKKLAKRCKKLAEIEKIAMTPANSCHDLAIFSI